MNIFFVTAYLEVIYTCLKMLSRPEANARKILKILFEISLQPTNSASYQKQQNLIPSNRMTTIFLAAHHLATDLYLESARELRGHWICNLSIRTGTKTFGLCMM